MILFPVLAALAVWWMGRRDISRDPRMTGLAIALLALLPGMLLLPKIPLLPPAMGKIRAGGIPAGWVHGMVVVWLMGCGVGDRPWWTASPERWKSGSSMDYGVRWPPGFSGE